VWVEEWVSGQMDVTVPSDWEYTAKKNWTFGKRERQI
jgi:hypothetical protein